MINAKTKVLAVIGKPIVHSKSPLIHNTGLIKNKIDAVYLAFEVTDVKRSIDAMRELGFLGYSVTIPHKVEAMKYVDDISESAKKIGAINTIVNKNGKLFGHNTDCDGFIAALKEKTIVKGKKVHLIGAGGAARAIAAGLTQEGAKVKIFDIDEAKAAALAKDFNCESGKLDKVDGNCDVLVNATPAGMHPNTETMSVPKSILKKGTIVFDIVYNPLETMLIKEAKKAGCTTIIGVEMFLGQAFAQFEMFTGEKAPKKEMRKALLTELKKEAAVKK
ncbi:MAG: shikimate dehydrogenase [archaeon]